MTLVYHNITNKGDYIVEYLAQVHIDTKTDGEDKIVN